jgi:hypothetical protein
MLTPKDGLQRWNLWQIRGLAMKFKALCLLLGFWVPCEALSQERWYRIDLETVHAGYAHWQREINNDVVRTQLKTTIKIATPNGTKTMNQRVLHEERLQGGALRFEWQQSDGSELHKMSGVIAGQQLRVIEQQGKTIDEKNLSWSNEYLFPYAYEQAIKQQLNRSQWQYVNFDVGSLTPERIDMQIRAQRDASYWIEQRAESSGNSAKVSLVIDVNAQMRELKQWLSGVPVTWILTTREQAMRSVRAFDPSQWNVLQSPYRISDKATKGKIRYELSVPVEMRDQWPRSAEQKMSATEQGVRVEVCASCRYAADEIILDKNFLYANHWLDYESAAVRRLAFKRGSSSKDAYKAMQAMTRTVREHLINDGSPLEFLTASQAARFQRGDCNEHARLLAAMGRSRGIRTRIAIGLVYRDHHSTRKAVFTPHSWVQAWIDGRWISFDPAMGFFGAGHIMLSTSEGDPAVDQAALERISQFKIISAAQIQTAQK